MKPRDKKLSREEHVRDRRMKAAAAMHRLKEAAAAGTSLRAHGMSSLVEQWASNQRHLRARRANPDDTCWALSVQVKGCEGAVCISSASPASFWAPVESALIALPLWFYHEPRERCSCH